MSGDIGDTKGRCPTWKAVGGAIIVLIILRMLATLGGKLESASKSEIMPWASPNVV